MKAFALILLSLLLSAAPLSFASSAIERGKVVAATCVACHQNNGMGLNHEQGDSWPRLAGLDADYIKKQLNDFKQGKRDNATMKPFASMLNDQQINDVAQYFSSLKASAINSKADQKLIQQGKKLATQGDWQRYIVPCSKCHGPDNQGSGAHFPAIVQQQPNYLTAQLNAFKDGTRSNDPQQLMQAIAKRLSAQDIQALAAYLASQP